MISIKIEIDEKTLRRLVREHLTNVVGVPLSDTEIDIQVRSKQNYKSEWEAAAFRAVVDTRRDIGL